METKHVFQTPPDIPLSESGSRFCELCGEYMTHENHVSLDAWMESLKATGETK